MGIRGTGPGRGQQGVTLVELSFAMMIMAIVVAAVYTVFLSQQKANLVQNEINELQNNARVGLELMANDVRQATAFNYADLALASIKAKDANSALECIKWSVLASVLRRAFEDPCSTTATTMDMDVNVINLSFTYYDYQDTALATPVAAPYLIRRVLISFAVYSTKEAAKIAGQPRVRTLKTSVTTRNMWLTSY